MGTSGVAASLPEAPTPAAARRGTAPVRLGYPPPPVELLLIRHALPLRVENRDGTPADPPLSAEGRLQAERLAAWLTDDKIDAVYTSPLRRARETAEPLAGALGLRARVEP